MQEHDRKSMLDYLSNKLSSAKQRLFIHRLVYFTVETPRDDASLSAAIEENVKDAIYGQWSLPLAGMSISTPRYFINIMEGTENALTKHLILVSKILKDVKILLFLPHVRKRYFMNWTNIVAEPASAATVGACQERDDVLLAGKCIEKLTSLFDLPQRLRDAELQEATSPITPDVQLDLAELSDLIKYLASSPLVSPLKNTSTVSHYTTQHHLVWPAPSQFIPRFINK